MTNDYVDAFDVVAFSPYLQPLRQDSCLQGNGGCSQLCFPHPRGRSCGCAIGYVLDGDGKSCNSLVLEEFFVMFVDPYHKSVYQMTDNNTRTQGVPLHLPNHPISADYDRAGRAVFWIDEEDHAIRASNLDGSNHWIVYKARDGERPERICVDPDKRTVYYTDGGLNSIIRVNMDGSDRSPIVTQQNRPYGLAVDYANKKRVYWSDRGTGSIRSSDLDGGNLGTEVATGMAGVTSLFVNIGDDRLFWSDMDRRSVHSLNLTSRLQIELYQDSGKVITSVAATDAYVYFVTRSQKAVFRIPLTDAQTYQAELLDEPIFARIADIRTYREKMPEPGIPVWAMAVAGVGGFLFLLLLLLLLLGLLALLRRKKKKQPPPPGESVGGFDHPGYEDDIENSIVKNGSAGALLASPNVAILPARGQSTNNDRRPVPPPLPGRPSGRGGALPPPSPDASGTLGAPPLPPPLPPANGHQPDQSQNGHLPKGAVPIFVTPPPGTAPYVPAKKFKKSGVEKPPPPPPKKDFKSKDNANTGLRKRMEKLRNRLSGMRWSGGEDEFNANRLADPTDAPTMSTIGPERKDADPNKRKVYIPPSTHPPPRGFSPASHVVPR